MKESTKEGRLAKETEQMVWEIGSETVVWHQSKEKEVGIRKQGVSNRARENLASVVRQGPKCAHWMWGVEVSGGPRKSCFCGMMGNKTHQEEVEKE